MRALPLDAREGATYKEFFRPGASKYALLGQDGVLAFEYEMAHLSDVGGLAALKQWLARRRAPFLSADPKDIDRPKGVLLVRVQGSGKSLAAKACAGIFGVPLLRLDFGVLYNKFHGETEKNIREGLKTAALMAPCVLWMDEIEKGIANNEHDGGTSRRVLATLLTWMAENTARVHRHDRGRGQLLSFAIQAPVSGRNALLCRLPRACTVSTRLA